MITIIFSIIVFCISLLGFWNEGFFNASTFSPSLMKKNLGQIYFRTAFYSFFHVDWLHLIVNLMVFIPLGWKIEHTLGQTNYGHIIFYSIVLCPLFSFIRHINSKNYHSVGISGITSCFMTLGLFICSSWMFYLAAGTTFATYFFGKKDWIAQEVHISGYILGIILGLLFNNYIL